MSARVDGTPKPAAALQNVIAFCTSHYVGLSVAVLGLAAFNLACRLGQEAVRQWDESLYAVSAWEMVRSGDWLRTTFFGAVDYYNTKPPLNVWLIALSFKAFGINLISLRLPSVLSAWCTIAVIMAWSRRVHGPPVALMAGLVLSSMFGFFYVHSARTANTDALFTLLILLTVVALWAAEHRAWHIAWLGLLAAAAFLLRGMGALMPLAIVLAFAVLHRHRRPGCTGPAFVALVLFILPVTAWTVARYHVDQWRFLERLFMYDFVARSTRAIETHRGTALFYLNVLQKYHYDWLLAGALSWLLFPVRWQQVRNLVLFWRSGNNLDTLLVCWAGVTLLLPMVMTTKVSWYLNPFYPVCALGIAGLLIHAVSQAQVGRPLRRAILLVFIATAFVSAETRLMWNSYYRRNLANSVQGLLIAEGRHLSRQRVFRSHWDAAETFVLGGVLDARRALAAGPEDFWRQSRPGDYLVSGLDYQDMRLILVRSDAHQRLYRRLN